ncbi:MAG: ATP-binding protein [Candidatus Bipolaricaulota bacterium]|nr:ATP-binding protein [Candidatus Bipolaricaulota bacterium]
MKFFRRLSFQTKLVVSLILVIVLTTILGYLLIHSAINRAFTDFAKRSVSNQDLVFRQMLVEYYRRAGSWDGLDRLFLRNRDLLPFFVADADGIIISAPDFHMIGNELSRSELAAGLPIIVAGKTVGTLLSRGILRLRDPVEKHFLGTVTVSLWISAVIVSLIGILLSIFLFRQLTGPLKRLNAAAGDIAHGKLTSRVEVHSQDELGHLAESFNKMAASLQKSEQVKRRMIADVSHELRTPISVVRTGLEAMRDGLLEASPANIAALHDKIMLTTRLVGDLQQLALADAGQLSIHKEPLDLAELVERIRTTVEVELEDRGVALQIDIPVDLPRVSADRQRIEQVLLNLLANAMRYTPSGGAISVAANQTDEAMLQVTVCDSGTGLSKEDMEHAFDRFYRADAARAREEGSESSGSGLGLAIAKALVEAHGGRIRAKNSPTGGACFQFTLPRV